jgi:K(+)-stimulated pyrophosphate-energized sodium pump
MIFDLGILAPAAGGVGLLFALILFILMMRRPVENSKILAVAEEIRAGASAFMASEYKRILLVVVVVSGLLYPLTSWQTVVAFILGSTTSALCGWLGVQSTTRGNVRTAVAAKNGGRKLALLISFNTSAVMGLSVASLGLVSVGGLFFLFGHSEETAPMISGFAMGASAVALFARIGGGIFTKAADVGTDMVGKIDIGIPEDDPRNPGVIADNVGDNVGDVGGMGADIFESYVGALIATIAIAATMTPAEIQQNYLGLDKDMLLSLPLLVGVVGLAASILAILSMNFLKRLNASAAFAIAEVFALVLTLVSLGIYLQSIASNMNVFIALAAGAICGFAISKVIGYYTSARPVRKIVAASLTGASTNVIAGLALGFESAAAPLALVAMTLWVAFEYAGLYGVSIAAVGMLSTVGLTMTLDCFGPVADNAGGLAQMAGYDIEVRKITDELDSVGNSTAAIGKGFAACSAALTAFALFVAFKQVARAAGIKVDMDISDPHVIIGLFIGAIVVMLSAALIIRSVGIAAIKIVDEIRRQFREIPGLLNGTGKPDTTRCIEIATQVSQKEMILPAMLALVVPVLVGKFLGVAALGGVLCGSLLLGVALALFMANTGGAWDNAKKLIESGQIEGQKKGGVAHQAAVIGDTVGDPLKDAAGPSLNILVKLMAIVAVVIIPLLK